MHQSCVRERTANRAAVTLEEMYRRSPCAIERSMKYTNTIAITGANRGLGKALALAFAETGAELIIHGRDAEALNPVAAEAEKRGAPRVTRVIGDLLDPDLGGRLAEACSEQHGGIDTIVLNAAILGPMLPLVQTPMDVFSTVMRTNVDAQVPLVAAVLPLMKARGAGKIVWLSSGLGRFGLPRYGVYCASKHAVEGLMKTVAEEHGASGIVSVSVAPGMVQTEMLQAALLGADVSEYQTPQETAEAFVRLVAELREEHNGEGLDIAPWL